MKNLLNPKWVLLINTLPVAILFTLLYGEYHVINSLLEENSIFLWKFFGGTLLAISLLHLARAMYLIREQKKISTPESFIALFVYITFLYVYGNFANDLVPFSIPRWMIPTNISLYAGSFLMPTLLHALIVPAIRFSSESNLNKIGKNLGIALLVPLVWYVLSQLILPLWKHVDSGFETHGIIIFIISGTVIFFFFLIRGLYQITVRYAHRRTIHSLFWKIPIALLLPLTGLSVNNGLLFDLGESGIFGDFSSPWFYGIAILNGILICLPHPVQPLYRLFLFLARSITFTYTLYFFLIFLPFLPLSVVAIVAVGTGFLMLTPLALFAVHTQLLSSDYRDLRKQYSPKSLIITFLLGLAILPVSVTLSYLGEKQTLESTLDYLYSPDYSKTYDIDKDRLARTLEVLKAHKSRNSDFLFSGQLPFLSSYYNWLVLDNLTLSTSKINMIEKIFFGKGGDRFTGNGVEEGSPLVRISGFSVDSHFDKGQNAWISWLHLEITDHEERDIISEYATVFALPAGCWINDYYLYVGDRKEMGMLTEKKAATWVYSQIRNIRRDPGLLHYISGNKVSFRVFPFARGETRKTGIQFIHKEPVTLQVDDRQIQLGNDQEHHSTPVPGPVSKRVTYIGSQQKSSLPRVRREPYYHFVVDNSEGKSGLKEQYIRNIQSLLDKDLIPSKKHQISFTNTYTTPVDFDRSWKEHFDRHSHEGGFYLERGIEKILHDAYLKKDGTYPLIVIVTDDMENAIIEKDFSDFRFAFPESDLFYHLQPFGHLIPHSLANNPKTPVSNPPPLQLSHEVYAYPGKEQPKAWLPVSTGGDIVLQQTVFDIKDEEIIQGNWATGLLLQGKVMSQALHPDRADREWLDLVKYSFNAHVMIPYTSFMVVENEAQKAMLEKKQAQALAGHKNLDVGENTRQMSEPGLIFLVLLTLLLWSVKNRAWLKIFWGPPLGVGLSALAGHRYKPFRAQTDASIPGPTRTKD